MIPHDLHKQLFPGKQPIIKDPRYGQLAARNLKRMGLLGSALPTVIDLSIRLPKIVGNSIAEHMYAISSHQIRPYLDIIGQFYDPGKPFDPPSRKDWQIRPGWVEYKFNSDRKGYDTRAVPYPEGDVMAFDTEVFFNRSQYPAIATALTPVAWYLWISPAVVDNYHYRKKKDAIDFFEGTDILESAPLSSIESFNRDNRNMGLEFDILKEERMFSADDDEVEKCYVGPFNYKEITGCDKPSFLRTDDEEEDEEDNAFSAIPTGKAPAHLVPLGPQDKEKVIVGHNANYDRSKVLEEHNYHSRKFVYLDTMSLHNTISGLPMQLYPKWTFDKNATRSQIDNKKSTKKKIYKGSEVPTNKYLLRCLYHHGFFGDDTHSFMDKEDFRDFEDFQRSWSEITSPSGLDDVASLYMGVDVDKSMRGITATIDLHKACSDEHLRDLISYCANDSDLTFHLFKILFVIFRFKNPHPASLAAAFILSKPYLTTSPKWDTFLSNGEKTYNNHMDVIKAHIESVATRAAKLGMRYPDVRKDPYLRYLNWTPSTTEFEFNDSFPTALFKFDRSKIPRWLRNILNPDNGQLDISMSSFVIPYLLRMKFDGYYIYYSRFFGWTYKVPKTDTEGLEKARSQGVPVEFGKNKGDAKYEKNASHDEDNVYFRIPCPETKDKFCNNPFSKSYTEHFEENRFTSEYDWLNTIVSLYHECTLWTSVKSRIKNELVAWSFQDPNIGFGTKDKKSMDVGVILPKTIPAGTLTRRVVDQTWLTAPNPEPTMIGSEIKLCIHTPDDYCIIGSDVDSEELWVATLMADAQYGIHGSTPVGFMMLQGDKSRGTDMHSLTAKTLLVDRDEAKIYNYARFYGAGREFVETMMETLHGHEVSSKEICERATNLMKNTKGIRISIPRRKKSKYSRSRGKDSYWIGGTESHLFNSIEGYVERSRVPRTPALGCCMPTSLLTQYVGFKHRRTRHNWIVQSSGVDYLHLLIVTMKYLMERMKIDGRYMISVHDEIRFLVARKDMYMALLAFQVANLWIRATFSQSMGINDLAVATSFFSEIDVDHCLRKEVDAYTVTPSYDVKEPEGKRYNIHDLLLYFTQSKYRIRVSDDDDDPNLVDPYGEELEGMEKEEEDIYAAKVVSLSDEYYDIEGFDGLICDEVEAHIENSMLNLVYAQSTENQWIASTRFQKAAMPYIYPMEKIIEAHDLQRESNALMRRASRGPPASGVSSR